MARRLIGTPPSLSRAPDRRPFVGFVYVTENNRYL